MYSFCGTSGKAWDSSAMGWVWENKYQTPTGPTKNTLQTAIWSFPCPVPLSAVAVSHWRWGALGLSCQQALCSAYGSEHLTLPPTPLLEPSCHTLNKKPLSMHTLLALLHLCTQVVPKCSPMQMAILPPEEKDSKGGFLWITDQVVI